MDEPKKILDLSVDFWFFVSACLFILGVNVRIISLQSTMYRNLKDKGVYAVEANTASYSTGEELVALLCYPEEVTKIVVDGVTYSGSFSDCMREISIDSCYAVERVRENDGSVSLSVQKLE